MKTRDSFEKRWIGTPSPDEGGTTYGEFPFETSLPLLSQNGFDWLIPLVPDLLREMAQFGVGGEEEKIQGNLAKVQREANSRSLRIPGAFVNFMSSNELRNRIPSCTACYFELSERLVPSPFKTGEWLIRFLNDQQGCCCWYLYFSGDEEPFVICSGGTDDEPFLDKHQPPLSDLLVKDIIQHTAFVAPNFERFIYRFWYENVEWYERAKK